MIRIGHGYDVHQLTENRKLILGGVEIPHPKGLLGHSDADVLVHSIMDSLIGSLSLGDIGKLFPDTDAQYQNANSINLLSHVYALVKEKGYLLGNLDATLLAQKPKLSPHIPLMRQNIADILETSIENISVKATTEEYLGFTGTEQGMACHCVCLLFKK